MRRFFCLSLILFSLFSFLACNKTGFDAQDPVAQVSMKSDGSVYMSVFTVIEERARDGLKFTLTSPDEKLTWSFDPVFYNHSNRLYAGSASLAFPVDFDVPQGDWTLLVVFKDGKTKSFTVPVHYTMPDVMPDFESLPLYDETLNITFI